MNEIKNEIKKLLRYEVATKSSAPAVTFILFAIFSYFYCFNCFKYSWIIKSSAVFIILINVFRLRFSHEIDRAKKMSDADWRYLRTYIWLNTLGWSTLFTAATYELEFQSIHFVALSILLSGFTAASLVTLSYDDSIFLPFQFLIIGPQIILATRQLIVAPQTNAGPLIPIYVMYFLYQLRQYRTFRDNLVQRFIYQLDLERSNNELKKSKEALVEQTAKLIHTSRLAALGEMSAGIAHEVNNPLAIISGGLQQLEKLISKDSQDKEKMLKLTSQSERSIDRITKIISGLRHFSQQSDALPKKHTELKNIVDDTFNFCSEMLEARNIGLFLDPIPSISFNCHAVQISQVLINLIKNAEDAINGESSQEHRWIKLSFESQEEYFLIKVRNGGAQISQVVETKLFEPFFTTKPIGKGTGLGLSISRGIMKEHGGDLYYEPSSRETIFVLKIPITKN